MPGIPEYDFDKPKFSSGCCGGTGGAGYLLLVR
jgi:hypothetical protein